MEEAVAGESNDAIIISGDRMEKAVEADSDDNAPDVEAARAQ